MPDPKDYMDEDYVFVKAHVRRRPGYSRLDYSAGRHDLSGLIFLTLIYVFAVFTIGYMMYMFGLISLATIIVMTSLPFAVALGYATVTMFRRHSTSAQTITWVGLTYGAIPAQLLMLHFTDGGDPPHGPLPLTVSLVTAVIPAAVALGYFVIRMLRNR